MRAGAADIGILADSADLQGLQTHPFRHDPLVLVVARGHALAQSASAGPAEIAAHDFIGMAEGRALQDHIAQHRSEDRRVGKECVSKCSSRWSPYHYKKK